jgi:hypothetical protein
VHFLGEKELVHEKGKFISVHEAYWGVEVQLHTFLISALDGNKWLASPYIHFSPEEIIPGKH